MEIAVRVNTLCFSYRAVELRSRFFPLGPVQFLDLDATAGFQSYEINVMFIGDRMWNRTYANHNGAVVKSFHNREMFLDSGILGLWKKFVHWGAAAVRCNA